MGRAGLRSYWCLASVRCHKSYATISYDLTNATQSLKRSRNYGPFLNPLTAEIRRMTCLVATRSSVSTGGERGPGCRCTCMYSLIYTG